MLRFALALCLWSLVGSILCRRSAMLFVGNDESTVRRGIDYGLRRWRASASGPLIPLASALLIGLMIAAIGLVGRLPGLGFIVFWIALPVVIIMGFTMAFLLLATAFGWPLMMAAVSTDDCDGFGALSRAYSGLSGRPWHAMGYASIGTLVGVVLMAVVHLIAETTIWCAMSGTALGSGEEWAYESIQVILTPVVHALVSGVGISFFWSTAVVIYLLLRLDVDGVPLDRIAVDDDARPVRDPLPVVGIPATDARTGID